MLLELLTVHCRWVLVVSRSFVDLKSVNSEEVIQDTKGNHQDHDYNVADPALALGELEVFPLDVAR